MFRNEEKIRQNLAARFGLTADTSRLQRARRVWVEVPYDRSRDLLLHAVKTLEFSHLCTISGLDEGESFAIIYHLARTDGIVLNLRTRVPKSAPVLKTVSDVFPGGLIYERELEDLLGVKVEGLPPGKRYPLPDNWPAGQFPLRKDWTGDKLDNTKTPKAEETTHA